MLSKFGPLACFLALLFPSVSFAAVEMTARNISYPFFNQAGRLTHRIKAESAAQTGQVRNLRGVVVEYFEAGDPTRVTQRIAASEAVWDDKQQTLAGDGAISVETDVNRLSGEGFLFALERSRMDIHRKFAMSNEEVDLTSDRAVIDLVLERSGKDDSEVRVRDIKRCEATGNLHVKVRPAAKDKFEVDEASSERAVYDGATHTITIPKESQLMRKGKRWTSSEASFVLDQKTRPALKLAK